MNLMKKFLQFIAVFLTFISACYSADLQLKIGKQSINLPYWPATEPHYGGAILVRGGAQGPSSDFLAQLARLLAKNGWSTLVLNSSPAVGAASWVTQLPEVINLLRKDKNKRIILIHYGAQLNTALDYLNKPQSKKVNGLILLSAYDTQSSSINSSRFRIPIFDVFGQFDYAMVRQQVSEREIAFASNTYRFVEIPGANHEYDYAKELLSAFLSGWMMNLPETSLQPLPVVRQPVAQSYVEPIYSLSSDMVALN